MASTSENDGSASVGSKAGKPVLLCVGNDEALLSYRAKVLALAGFEVVCARPQSRQANQYGDLCRLHGPAMTIVCHTLTLRQRIEIARELREACPHMSLLALTNGDLTAAEAQVYDILLDSLDGPAELIRQVRSHL